MKSSSIFFVVIIIILTGCSSESMPPSPTFTEDSSAEHIITTSTAMPTYTPFPTAERMPTSTPYPTTAPLSLPTIIPTITPTATPGNNQSEPVTTPSDIATITGSGPDLTPILIVIDTGATCRGSSQFKEALFQLGVVNRGNAPANDTYEIVWSLGWDDFKGVERITTVNYHEWGLQWTVWLENKYFWVPCDSTTTFTAYINADTSNTVAELNEGNNTASQSYLITYVP